MSGSSFESTQETLLTSLRTLSSSNKYSEIDKKEYVYSDIIKNFEQKDGFKDKNLENLKKKLMNNFYETNRLTKHHLDSFNHFVKNTLPKLINNYSPIIVQSNYNQLVKKYIEEYHIIFGEVYIGKPGIKEKDGTTKMLFPIETRWRNLTYAVDIYVDISFKHIKYSLSKDEEPKETNYPSLNKVVLCSLPLIVKSEFCSLNNIYNKSQEELGECRYDQGGYFIIKGAEKVLITQEQKCENKILAFPQNKTQTTYSNIVEINSVSKIRAINRLTQLKMSKRKGNETIYVSIQRFRSENPIPLYIVFRAMGIISDKAITEKIIYNIKSKENRKLLELLKPSIKESSGIQTQEMALLYMSNYIAKFPEIKDEDEKEEKGRMNFVLNTLENELFPHVGNNLNNKAWFLGLMARKIIDTNLGIREYDDRDSFLNKRLVTSGLLMEQLFIKNLAKLVKDLTKEADKDMRAGNVNDIHKNIKLKLNNAKNSIGSSIRYSLSTGNWGMKTQMSTSKKGIAQPLSRVCVSSTLSHLRRVNAPRSEKGGKNTEPRKLHATQWMRFDPSETPDGHTIGFVKNMALSVEFTNWLDPITIIERLRSPHFKINLMDTVTPFMMENQVRIFINGNPHGTTNEPQKIYFILKKLKQESRCGQISISWVIQEQEIRIHTEEGRAIRPIFVVENNRLLITYDDFKERKTWDALCNEGKIEYLDVQEEDTAMIATYYEDLLRNSQENNTFVRYTHCEIDLTLMFGAVTSIIPLVSNNQGARVMFEAGQKKQALSIYATNYRDRMDATAHILRFPQLPLVTTRTAKHLFEKNLPSGQNAIVAIASYTGHNQEDSLMMNESSTDRGMFTSMYYKTYKDSERKNQASLEEEKFCKPVKYNQNGTLRTAGTKSGSYDLLDDRGFIKVDSHVKEKDVIIGKVVPIKNVIDNGPKFKDASISIEANGTGIVDWVYVNTDSEDYQFAKVRIRTLRYPGIGDKFCLTPDHEVLTDIGWIPVQYLSRQHKVATLHDDKYLKYEFPSEIHTFDMNNDDMYEVNSKNVNLCVTPNHKMYVKRTDKYELLDAKDTALENVTYKKDFIWDMSQDLPKSLEHLKNTNLNAILDQLVPDKSKGFLHSSKTIIDNLQLLALHCGFVTNICISCDKYCLNFVDGEHTVDKSEGNWISYTGKVYCCTVSSGVFYVRRNGCPVWTGNSSRYGQKGTIGRMYKQEDMPCTAEGITPDIIISPFAIPSRMTIGQLLEMIIGKAAAVDGFECDATSFASSQKDLPNILSNALKNTGYQEYGTEELYNPKNGEKIKAKIFIGVSYYQRLKHMSKDKLHARATGPLQLLTRQPPEGRKRDGGFRVGEMEKDCILGYASVSFIKEKLFDNSDNYAFYTCNICGSIAVANSKKNIFKCLTCKDSYDFSQVQAPYSFKLFFQELISMGIMPRIYT